MDSNNMNAGTTNTQTTIPPIPPVPPVSGYTAPTQGGQSAPKSKSSPSADPKFLIAVAVAVVLLLILVIPAIVKASEESKVKKSFETFFSVFVTGDKDPEDVKWRNFYPKDVEDDIEDWAIDRYDYMDDYNMFDSRAEYTVLSITALKGSDNISMFEDLVEDFFEDADCRIRSKDLKISKCYVVLIRDDSSRDPELGYVLVAKVNGSYGVYYVGSLYY